MAEAQTEGKLYTLTQVSQKTKVSMPTLQRYKKLYQDRIPSVGKGRTQRYPEAALEVFRELKKENISRRGRPRKSASAGSARKGRAKRGRKAKRQAPATAAAGEGLLTLTQIQGKTGISYPTLLRYVKSHLKDIPHKGSGRSRRFPPEAVAVFKELRSKSKRGRKAGSGAGRKAVAATGARRGRPVQSAESSDLAARIQALEKVNKQLERSLSTIEKKLSKIRIVMR